MPIDYLCDRNEAFEVRRPKGSAGYNQKEKETFYRSVEMLRV